MRRKELLAATHPGRGRLDLMGASLTKWPLRVHRRVRLALDPPASASPLHPAVRSPLTRLRGPVLLGVVAAVYLALAQLVIWLNDPVQLGAGFWPAAGFS